MILEGLREQGEKDSLRGSALLVQGIATSIDALSVGFTIAEYDLVFAAVESLIIGIVTFGLCLAGLLLGGRIGSRLSGKACIFGGIILILIGIVVGGRMFGSVGVLLAIPSIAILDNMYKEFLLPKLEARSK